MTDTDAGAFTTVLFDWAGTITVPMHEMLIAAARELGMSDEQIGDAFTGLVEYFSSTDSPIHQAERGEIDDDELAEFIDGKVPGSSRLLLDPAGPSFLNGADRPEMMSLLEDLRDADLTVVLATNNFRVAQELLARRYLDTGLVSAVVNSAMVGTRKPEPRFYGIALEAADADPTQTVFLDDQEVNLGPANDLGIRTILVGADPTAAIDEARTLLLP